MYAFHLNYRYKYRYMEKDKIKPSSSLYSKYQNEDTERVEWDQNYEQDQYQSKKIKTYIQWEEGDHPYPLCHQRQLPYYSFRSLQSL